MQVRGVADLRKQKMILLLQVIDRIRHFQLIIVIEKYLPCSLTESYLNTATSNFSGAIYLLAASVIWLN
jgi:hypothetical protein